MTHLMKLTTETFGQVTVIHTPDELNTESLPQLIDAIDSTLSEGHLQLVLEMDRTELFDSDGLNGLLDVQDKVRSCGGNVKVSGLPELGRKVFEITRLDQRFDLFESVIEAVSSYR